MTHSTARDRQHLEHLWRVPPTPHSVEYNSVENNSAKESVAHIPNWLKLAGKSLVNFLTNTRQLRVWAKNTEAGTLWSAYDPISDQAISQTSEEGLRAWLEQRHYQ